MIYNSDILFIHVPKTGGMSISHALLSKLPGQVFLTLPHPKSEKVAGENILKGTRHENLIKAEAFLKQKNIGLAKFKAIFAVIRNPYDLEVSRFHYLQKGQPGDRGANQTLALTGDFKLFALNSRWWFDDFKDYYTIDGRVPANMTILRFECLQDDFETFCAPFLSESVKLPRKNVSERKAFAQYLDPEIEEAIYLKYRWIFDEGYYERIRIIQPA